ncbi:hypothetical protein GCM10010116_59410 [Microbispora rosea subsp. aerata]|nr:hypothetical protein [Microbispora rosea]GGO29614.1 hypothetical protein GCM10010116_59410 [Microbispora rosea subsp. aerata]GIH57669.1 hypothetical protein Mro02_45830 [Microbispora rosea subsp. aerata]GLJ85849.1 hypothetical protein GCM10017588_45820 [Microbispora rosea subsp. aerata]
MAKSTSVAGILAIGAILAGGAVVAGVPLVATPAEAATMSAQHGLVRSGNPHARGQRNRHKKGHRNKQRLSEKQRQHQFLMRDLTLVLVPYQKETTDARALPYNWQYDGAVAEQYAGQNRQSILDERAEANGINLDGEEHNSKTEVSPKEDTHKVEKEKKTRPAVKRVDPVIPQGDLVPAATVVPPTVPPPTTDPDIELQNVPPAGPELRPAEEPVVCAPLLGLPLNLSLTATVSLGGQQETAQQETAQSGTAQPQATTTDAACAPSSAS